MPKTVLIVEDADDLRFLLRVMLEKAGYVIVGDSATGRAAIEQAPLAQPDVVLVDLVLPDMSGLDVVRGVRAALPAACIVICSGAEKTDLATEGEAAGANGWLDKSNVVDLIPTLEALVERNE